MPKHKKARWIYSLIVMLTMLCASFFTPFLSHKGVKVKAENSSHTLYAFVEKQENQSNRGKIYVDFGLSIDAQEDDVVTREDAVAMTESNIYPFESAKIYLRTRNISAVAEEGDYEAFDQAFTVYGTNAFSSVSIDVKSGGLRIGDTNREFVVEVYKVEITGLKDGYEFVQPNVAREISSTKISISPEFAINQKTYYSYEGAYTLYKLDVREYKYFLGETTCRDVTQNTYFDDFKINLANINNGWYNKIKYLSEHDMVKLGIRASVSAYEEENSVYTDNSFVGIQIFAGDSSGVGAPALEGVPEENVYNYSSVAELARWYAKFQSDEIESMNVTEAFNGEFEGVNVQTMFDEHVYIPHSLSKKDYGQGGVYDAYVGGVSDDVIVIDDLSVFKGSTTISTRFWSYLSDKKKYCDGFINYVPINYRAKILSATFGQLYKDENGKEKIGVSVRFNEPVQFKKYSNGKEVAPSIEGYINGNAANKVKFEYAAGIGTDTLFFAADVSDYEMHITRIALNKTTGFEDVYDFSPDTTTGGNGNGHNQDLNVIYKDFVNGWDSIATKNYICSYDLRTPEISMNGSVTSTVKTAHTATITTAHVNENARLFYGWTADENTLPNTYIETAVSPQGFQTISSPANISGQRYLHAYVVSDIGKRSKDLKVGPFNFDNEDPILSVACTDNSYVEKNFSLTIKNNSISGFDKYAELKKTLKAIVSSDAYGKENAKEISITIPPDYLKNEVITIKDIKINAETLGLKLKGEKEYGTYYISFVATDALENQGKSEPIACYFDVREIFGTALVKSADDPAFEMDEFTTGVDGSLTLDKDYYTIDLSKKQEDKAFYFKMKASDDSVSLLGIDDFSSVKGVSVKNFVEEKCENGVLKITIKEKFAPGLYRLILKETADGSSKKSLPVYFYVTNGKDKTENQYKEETGIYQLVSNESAFTNKVYQIPLDVQYYYCTDTDEKKTASYSNINKPATFSSKESVYSYVLYREYLDLYAVTLTESLANDLNSNIGRKADGTIRAEVGQVWIRYKEANWRPDSTVNAWVYYYYAESSDSLPINLGALGSNLEVALNNVASYISGKCKEVHLVSEEYLDEYGSPTVQQGQMHLNAESSFHSICGTLFEKPAEYSGDLKMFVSFDATAPLSTNVSLQFSSNRRVFFKTEQSSYHLLINDGRETLGEYLNSTNKFTILELDENGAREYNVYIDKSAPTLRISWMTEDVAQSKVFSLDDMGKTISGSDFFIEDVDDYDSLSFVAVYKYTTQGEGDLLYVYRKTDFDEGKRFALEDGKYYLHVSDRSGNDYTFIVQAKSDPLVCTVTPEANTSIKISINRDETEVRYQVFLDGWLLTTDIREFKFTQGGRYRFLVEDIYGNVYDETFEFKRDLPTVTWQYKSADGGRFETYKNDNEQLVLRNVDEQNYLISTSTYLRFMSIQGCAYTILSGNVKPSESISNGWVTFNEISAFTMKVYYEADPEIYVIYTCTVDNFPPKITVSYEERYYQAVEIQEILETFKKDEFKVGETLFTPSSIAFTGQSRVQTLSVENGGKAQSKYFKVQVLDESGVKEVKVYLNGELILTKAADFGNIYVSRRGIYEIVATDDFGNKSTFTFANEYEESVEYFVDEERTTTDVSYADHFSGNTYTKVDYANTQTQVKFLSAAEAHYIITDEDGNRYYFAFVVEDGAVYKFEYVVKVIDVGEGKEIESLSTRSATPLKVGAVATIEKLGVAIYLSKNSDNTVSLRVRSMDDKTKTYTVETRISASKNEMPYYFKTKISNVASSIGFIDGKGRPLTALETIKVNESFKISNNIAEEIKSVEVAYSQTGNYTTYKTVYDGSLQDLLFDEEGMYHVKVVNVYGVQKDYYVLISARFAMTATLGYADETVVEYSISHTEKSTKFLSNKSVEVIVYASNVSVLDKPEGVSVTLNSQGYTVIYVDKAGEYPLTIQDEYGNEIEKTIVIKTDIFTIGEDVLTKCNENALRFDENYTNQKIFIHKNVVLSEDKIAFISMVYGNKTVTVYDMLSEETTTFDEDKYVGVLGDGEYKLIFRDYYGNKAEKTIHYCGTPTLEITRKTLNSVALEKYSLEDAVNVGVWTNDTVYFSVSAIEYRLTVDDMENVFAISYSTKTKNEYEVYYIDEYGFEYRFTVYLLRQEVEIKPMESMQISSIADLHITKDGVGVEFSENALCTYVLNDGEEKPYTKGDSLFKDGIYRFKAVDMAGNLSTYVVKKDSAVEYRLEGTGANEVLINGGVTNGNYVRFYAENGDSSYIKKVFHNNEYIEYDDENFTERGKWELIVADEVGNETYFRFYLLYGKMDGFTYSTPYKYEITSVLWEFEDTIADAEETVKEYGTLLDAKENGKYTVTMRSSVTGDVKTFNFTIDKTPPQVQLVGCEQNEKTINNITLSGCKVGDVVYVYRDSELVKTVRIDSDYTDPPTINESGKYKIVVENEAGIKTELVFERKYIPNVAGSVLIIILALAAVAGLMVGLIWRNHSKTDD